MSRPKRKELLRQIALLRRALLCDEDHRDMFRAEALGASGGQYITLADYTLRTAMPPGIWRAIVDQLNSPNEILDDISMEKLDEQI
jgi:hypothetical protein